MSLSFMEYVDSKLKEKDFTISTKSLITENNKPKETKKVEIKSSNSLAKEVKLLMDGLNDDENFTPKYVKKVDGTKGNIKEEPLVTNKKNRMSQKDIMDASLLL